MIVTGIDEEVQLSSVGISLLILLTRIYLDLLVLNAMLDVIKTTIELIKFHKSTDLATKEKGTA